MSGLPFSTAAARAAMRPAKDGQIHPPEEA